MNVLGNAGSIYMVVLIFLLIVGLGLIIKGLFQMIIGKRLKNTKQSGGGFVLNQSVSWLKLATISFIGMIIGLMLLSFIAPYGTNEISMGMGSGGNSMMNSSSGSMASHTSSNTTSGMNSMAQPGTGSADINSMMQTLNQMQLQISQMQQQIMMNSQVQATPQSVMNAGGMSGSSSGGSTGGSSGSMGMM